LAANRISADRLMRRACGTALLLQAQPLVQFTLGQDAAFDQNLTEAGLLFRRHQRRDRSLR